MRHSLWTGRTIVGLGLFLLACPSTAQDGEPPTFLNVDKRSFVDDCKLWRQRDIPVCWEAPDPATAADRSLVERAIAQTCAASSCIAFTGWKACGPHTKGIRIRVADEGPHVKALGRMLDGKKDGMVLNFRFGTFNKGCLKNARERTRCIYSIAVHEFGHALAFAHEQNRTDTPGECTQLPQGPDGTVMLTPWDPSSVMNYCIPREKTNGVLSRWDVYTLNEFYCRSGGQLNPAERCGGD